MTESPTRPTQTQRPVGPGLLAGQRAVQAAELAAAAGQPRLAWASLRQWPAWAVAAQPPGAWQRALGACWHAAELQQCIDGARLNALSDDLGPQTLQAVLQLDANLPAGAAPARRLPTSGSAADWRDALAADGRTVALASLADAPLRTAVAAVLGWQEVPFRLPSAAARAWINLVQPGRT